jgi:hypothetical protein
VGPYERVEVAGEWDWNARTELTDSDGDGTLSAELMLPSGVHAYKLVVTQPGGNVVWLIDPGNPYRKYHDGVENSGVRVGDCSQPLLMVAGFEQNAGAATATVAFVRGNAGPNPDRASIRVTLTHDFSDESIDAELDGNRIRIATDKLVAGKYTLRVEAADLDGRDADPILLPFWVEQEQFDWRDTPIYMLMVDRFRNADPGNDPGATFGVDPGAEFFGGDLAGVTAAIEDGTFDELGIRALWLSPFVRNTTRFHYEESGHGVSAFHGYWPVRAREVDPRLGSDADLEALVAAAHARGIRVLMDFVVNHVHEDHEYFAEHPEWFRTGCECGTRRGSASNSRRRAPTTSCWARPRWAGAATMSARTSPSTPRSRATSDRTR